MSISIIGNGGLAREVGVYLKSMGLIFDYFVSDEYYQKTQSVYRLSEMPTDNPVIIAIANVMVKQSISKSLSDGIQYFTLIHPSAQVYTEHTIGEGSIICPNVVVTTNVKLGKHGLVNCNCTIGHDTEILDYFTINPNTAVSGNCSIGSRVFIGSSVSIREKVKITDDVVIGMGSVVIRNIDKSGKYIGTPAKKM